MNVVIIEDEAPAARRLAKLLASVSPEMTVVATIESVETGLEWFAVNKHPQLILADIQLADDLSFTLLQRVGTGVPVIFTTAYDEYAIRAFKFLSVDYLLKPVDPDDLRSAIDKFKTMQQPAPAIDFSLLLSKIETRDYRERILVFHGDALIPLPCADIAFFASEDGLTFAHRRNASRHIVDESLDKLEPQLNPKVFFRANRQYIISFDAIGGIHQFFNQKLKLTLATTPPVEIIISKERAPVFKKWLDR